MIYQHNQYSLGSGVDGGGRVTRTISAALIVGAALVGCASPGAPAPAPPVEYVTPPLEEELVLKLAENRLNSEDLVVRAADFENLESAAVAWWDKFAENCVRHGNPRLSYENNLRFVATAADLQTKVFEELRLGENLEVCRSSMMTDSPEALEWVNGPLRNLNTIFVSNQLLGAEPRFEVLSIEIESASESAVVGNTRISLSANTPNGVESSEENLGFTLTVSDEGNLLWSKRT